MLDINKLLNQIDIKESSIAADFGAGSGHFVIELAKRVGSEGKVYAIDVLKPALESIKGMANLHKIFNIETIWSDLEKTSGLPEKSCDLIVMSNLLFQVEVDNWENIFKDAKNVLRSDGKLLIVDWKKNSPANPSPNNYQASLENVKSKTENYFSLDKELDAGDNHWAILLSHRNI